MVVTSRNTILGLFVALALPACDRGPVPSRTPPDDEVFDVVVTGVTGVAGVNGGKITAIKKVREVTGWGLKKAKDFVESAPGALKTGLPEAEAKALAEDLRRSDLVVELRRK